MNNLFYVDTYGLASALLNLHSERYGDWQIDIYATGTTSDMVDWQMVGKMQCFDVKSGHHHAIGLVWDETRILTAYDGVEHLSGYEMDALSAAGFNLYNFQEVRGLDDKVGTSNEYAENRAAEMHAMLDDTEEADKAGDFNAVHFIMDFEAGALEEDEVIEGFQHMLDTGIVWQLQGSYQRMATAYLEAGLIHYNDRWA